MLAQEVDLPPPCAAQPSAGRRLIFIPNDTPSGQPSRWQKIAVAGAGIVALGALAGANPATSGWFPSCPFNTATGCYCPGCGSLRAMHALLGGNVGAAFSYNALSMLMLPLVASAVGVWLWPGQPVWKVRLEEWWRNRQWAWAVASAVIVFGVARNLPWPPFSWLAPGG